MNIGDLKRLDRCTGLRDLNRAPELKESYSPKTCRHNSVKLFMNMYIFSVKLYQPNSTILTSVSQLKKNQTI